MGAVVVVIVVVGEGVAVDVVVEGEGVVVVVVVIAGEGVVVVVVTGGGVVVVVVVVVLVVVSPSFGSVPLLRPPLACLVAGISCPADLLLVDGVLAISAKKMNNNGNIEVICIIAERAQSAHDPVYTKLCTVYLPTLTMCRSFEESRRLLTFLKGSWCRTHHKGIISGSPDSSATVAVSELSGMEATSMFSSVSFSKTSDEEVGTVGAEGDAEKVVVVGLVMV